MKELQNLTIKRILTIFALAISLLLYSNVLLPSVVGAQDKGDLCTGANLTFDETKKSCATKSGAPNTEQCGANNNENCAESKLNKLLGGALNIFSIIVGIAAVIMIMVGGFRYITSGGDSGKVTNAKNTILYAIVGLVVVALAQAIVKFVLNKLG